MPPELDCVIVGAGLVGTTAAIALTQAGRNVALLDLRPRPAANPSATDARVLVLSPASMRIFETLGLWSTLAARSQPIRHIHVSDRGGLGALRLHADDVGLAALGWACPADHLLNTLTAAAQLHVGERLSWSTGFRACHAGRSGMAVEAERDGAALDMTTALLIGADGAASAVRSALGITADRFDYGQTAIVAHVEAELPQADWAYERFTSSGPLAMLPAGGRRYVSVQCLEHAAAAHAMTLGDAAYLELLQRRFGGRLGTLTALHPRRSHPLARQRARRLIGSRAVIIGNAANTVHPNAAQGLNLGLRDVSALVQCVAASADCGDADALARYAAMRARDHRLTRGFTDTLARTFRSRSCGVISARRAALLLADLSPSLKRRLVIEASGLATLARYPLAS